MIATSPKKRTRTSCAARSLIVTGRAVCARNWFWSTSSSGTHQLSFDRNWIAEEIKNGAVGVNRRGQFLIASGVLWPAQTDVDANRVEAGADTVVDAKEPAQINIPVDADLDLVELDAELRRPDPISYRLTDSPLEEAGFEPSVPRKPRPATTASSCASSFADDDFVGRL